MAAEWARFNIQANAVAPTVILTAMGRQVWGDLAKGDPMKARIAARRFGEPQDVADLVLFLASPASDFICGQMIRIDGGFTSVWEPRSTPAGETRSMAVPFRSHVREAIRE